MEKNLKALLVGTTQITNIGYFTAPNGRRGLMINPPKFEFTEFQHLYIIDENSAPSIGDWMFDKDITNPINELKEELMDYE